MAVSTPAKQEEARHIAGSLWWEEMSSGEALGNYLMVSYGQAVAYRYLKCEQNSNQSDPVLELTLAFGFL